MEVGGGVGSGGRNLEGIVLDVESTGEDVAVLEDDAVGDVGGGDLAEVYDPSFGCCPGCSEQEGDDDDDVLFHVAGVDSFVVYPAGESNPAGRWVRVSCLGLGFGLRLRVGVGRGLGRGLGLRLGLVAGSLGEGMLTHVVDVAVQVDDGLLVVLGLVAGDEE